MYRHKTFISYHHSSTGDWFGKNDANYREEFEHLCSKQFDLIVSKSVQDGDIPIFSSSDNTHRIIRDKYLRDSTVTVVLIGNETWKRKHVDWEIASSLRDTSYNSRNGLIGIVLPNFKNKNHQTLLTVGLYKNNVQIENAYYTIDKNNIPERLSMNLDNGFAKIYDWSNNPYDISKWIHEAFQRRGKISPDNSLLMFSRNK